MRSLLSQSVGVCNEVWRRYSELPNKELWASIIDDLQNQYGLTRTEIGQIIWEKIEGVI